MKLQFRALPMFVGLLAISIVSRAAAPAPTNDYSAVEAILTEYCLDCHGSTEPEGKLVMENFDLLMRGGESGPAVVAGKSRDSLLVKMIEGRVEKDGKTLIMPPKKKREPLKPEQIELIKAWIDAGAKPPAEFKTRDLVVPKIEPKGPPRDSVNALAYAPALKLVAAARHGKVELRSAETHGVIRTLEGHRGSVNAVAFSPDGKFLFAAGGEAGAFGEVRQWNVADGTLVRVLEGHKDAVYALAVAPDGKTLATGSYDHKVKLWNVGTGEESRTLSGHNGAVFGLAFRPDGKILASASADRTVKLWDAATGERRDTLSQPLKDQYAVAFSPDGKRLVAGGVDNRIRVWQISEAAAETTNPLLEARFAHEGAVLKIAFSSDGKTLASSADDRTVKLWDATGPELTEKFLLDPQPDWAPALTFALDDRAVVVGRLEGSIEFYDASNGKILLPPKPELLRAEPRGIQRGRPAKVKLVGLHLEGITTVNSAQPRLKAELDATATAVPGEIPVTVHAQDDLPRGAYELSLTGPGGESGKIKLYVDDLPQILVPETNRTLRLETLPADIWATHEKSGDAEQIEFDAKAGQTLVFDAAARSLGSKADLVLTLSDANGKVLASNNGFDASPDPFLAHMFAEDGRYRILVSDLLLGASRDHFYRLSVGVLPYVTACFPMGAPANAPAEIELIGPNLPAEHRLRVNTQKPGEMELPIDAEKFRTRRAFKFVVSEGAETVEIEPNDTPDQATKITAPGAANGRIFASAPAGGPAGGSAQSGASASTPPRAANETDVDLFRFEAKAGQSWIIETAAAQLGSSVDTKIEVLDAGGKPVERLVLQAVRNSAINFRSIDSNAGGARLDNYEEMDLNEYVYFNGEVVKLFRMPQGPDSEMLFYTANGKRRAYFDTSAMAHALDETAYVVEPHSPGAHLAATGLPVFPIYFANDDDGERKLGSDSKLRFDAPADGAYLVRVADSRGYSGEGFAYRLILREPRPDFKVTLNGANPTVNAGSGREFSVNAERLDGFEGEIEVNITRLPPGFFVSSPLVIQSGHSEAKGTLCAAIDAAKPDETNAANSRITATAVIDGKKITREVANFGKIALAEKPKLFVLFEPDSPAGAAAPAPDEPARPYEITIAPGQTVPARLKVRRNGYDDLVTFTVENLPHGVIVDNIGLNGVLIPKGENERQIFLTAAKWVPEMDRFCYAIENQAGRQTSTPVQLHVRRAASPIATAGH